ncbi:hypothetical protein U1Q18_041895 [Sarracenia purpurea var. burkii]
MDEGNPEERETKIVASIEDPVLDKISVHSGEEALVGSNGKGDSLDVAETGERGGKDSDCLVNENQDGFFRAPHMLDKMPSPISPACVVLDQAVGIANRHPVKAKMPSLNVFDVVTPQMPKSVSDDKIGNFDIDNGVAHGLDEGRLAEEDGVAICVQPPGALKAMVEGMRMPTKRLAD